MLVSEISLWGAALVALFVIMAAIVLAFIDRKMLRRMLVIFGATIAQMIVVVAVVWLVYQTHAWWSYLLWYLLILLLSICWVLYPLQALWKKMLTPVGTAILVGSVVVGGCTILCLPIRSLPSTTTNLPSPRTHGMSRTEWRMISRSGTAFVCWMHLSVR